MKSRCQRLALCAASIGIVLAAPAAAAPVASKPMEVVTRAQVEATRPQSVSRTGEAPDFGIADYSVVNIGAYEFVGAHSSGDQLADDGNGYRFLNATTSGGFLSAPVRLPSGVSIDGLTLSYCAGATGSLAVTLYDAGAFGATISPIVTVLSGGNGACHVTTFSSSYQYSQNENHPLYLVMAWGASPLDGTMKFNNVGIRYHRLVSPAPGSPTFTDVPTDHPFFQYVEALAAAGITGGCGNGNFCPDAPLTRGQMAVFLSKALGLHWPH